MIPTTCGTSEDSILVDVLRSPGPVNLGTDKVICASNTIVLNAHSGYSLLMGGRMALPDSTYVVTAPGIYFVKVSDACGETYRDTVVVTTSAPVSIDLGPDRIKCSSDTIHIDAPLAFLIIRRAIVIILVLIL